MLIRPRPRSVRALVAAGDESFLGGNALEAEPAGRQLEEVDSPPPGVERHVTWRLRLGRGGERQQVRGGALAEVSQVGRDGAVYVPRQQRGEQRAQQG